MSIDRRINKWAAPTGSTGGDVCKALNIVTSISLYIILFILIIGGMI
jgi:hypothetical protein